MKKFLVALMAVLMIMPSFASNNAQAANSNGIDQHQITEYTYEDIKELKPYVSVKNGKFKFDSSQAKKDGFDKELVKMQKEHLSGMNKEIKNGKLKAQNNLEIVTVDSDSKVEVEQANPDLPVIEPNSPDDNVVASAVPYAKASSCLGKNTSVKYHWWGYSRYMDSCRAEKFAYDMAVVGAGAGGAGTAAALWFPPAGVAAGVMGMHATIMSVRASANNHGYGIIVEITYAQFFNIDPQ
ncbi:hypothetical protein [Guptibacillus hwajinpoensis]|uniref:Uncharacterized protein n=1 Tax=Guptibacillus hwajinpoensis TaxID=208199 RepID=A0A0J6CXJ0_9BACL|nr:hypothetical protein [Alkalihalobacillus macyae]KMM36759.1 hypothetical protein AB986_12525 [Alkalihalobacillus macyae]